MEASGFHVAKVYQIAAPSVGTLTPMRVRYEMMERQRINAVDANFPCQPTVIAIRQFHVGTTKYILAKTTLNVIDLETSHMAEQIGFEPSPNEFAENPEPRIPCILLVDTSGSMQGEPIRQLNEGLTVYKDACFADPLAAKRVEAAVVTFGGTVETQVDFSTITNFTPPNSRPGEIRRWVQPLCMPSKW